MCESCVKQVESHEIKSHETKQVARHMSEDSGSDFEGPSEEYASLNSAANQLNDLAKKMTHEPKDDP